MFAKLLHYFDLSLSSPEPVLGKRSERDRERARQQELRRTWILYGGVALGVLSESFLQLLISDASLADTDFWFRRIAISLIVSILIFPNIVPKIFGRMEVSRQELTVNEQFLQFCLAFQQGFFWPIVIWHVALV